VIKAILISQKYSLSIDPDLPGDFQGHLRDRMIEALLIAASFRAPITPPAAPPCLVRRMRTEAPACVSQAT
jgi:hypothetical protein